MGQEVQSGPDRAAEAPVTLSPWQAILLPGLQPSDL